MTLYKTILTPVSRFATPPRGDTLFGQLCWAVVHRYGEKRLQTLLDDYDENPFLIVSDLFAPGHLPKPSLPSTLLGESPDEKKTNRKKIWLTPDDLVVGRYERAKRDEEVGYKLRAETRVHNSLNYRTFRTDASGAFAPYGALEYAVSPGELYLLLDEGRLEAAELYELLGFVGAYGYGKESTIGKGRFEVGPLERCEFPVEGTTHMALSPVVLQDEEARIWYEPFTRFGKHGAQRAKRSRSNGRC
jgi:CRISPR-associated protein Csm4